MRPPLPRRPIWPAALLTTLLGVSACPAGGGDEPVPITAEQACAELATARCALLSACSLPDGASGLCSLLRERYGDLPTCLSREALGCASELAASGTGNTPVRVQKCVAAFMTYSCQDLLNNIPPLACRPAGARADGAACTFDSQCQSGTCAGNQNAACGTCGEAVADGESCAVTGCMRGERCQVSTAACAAVVPAGGACDDARPCDRGLDCLGADARTMKLGLCQPAGTRVGDRCDDTTQGCDPTRGLTCARAGDAEACEPIRYPGVVAGPDGGLTATADGGMPGPTPAGTPCGQFPDGLRLGCVAGTCVTGARPAGTTDPGVCLPFAADGEACVLVAGPGCLAPARCVVGPDGTTGTCLVPAGAPDQCPASG